MSHHFVAPTVLLAVILETPAGVKVGLDARHLWLKFRVFWAVWDFVDTTMTACKDSCQNFMWHCSLPLASYAHQNRDGLTKFGQVTTPRRQQWNPVTTSSAVLDGRRNVTNQTGKLLQFNTAQAPRITHVTQFSISLQFLGWSRNPTRVKKPEGS